MSGQNPSVALTQAGGQSSWKYAQATVRPGFSGLNRAASSSTSGNNRLKSPSRRPSMGEPSSKDSSMIRVDSAPEVPIQRIGVAGLGHMGDAFASNLIADGYQITVYDRDEKRTAQLIAAGAAGAAGLVDLGACEAVLTSLPDDDALEEVTLSDAGLIHVLAPGAIHVSMSTVSPALSRRLARQHQLAGQGYVAAPVLGNPSLAHARKLFVIAAGLPPAVTKISPVLERLGQRLFVLGDDAGTANLMKLAGNVLTALTLQSMGEVFALLRKGGIDPHVAFKVLTGSLFDGEVHKAYGGKIVDNRYSPPGMTVPLAVKDLRLALAEAEHTAVPMPAASLVHDRLVAMLARGWPELDWSALGLLAASEAGLAPVTNTEG
jgi:3-hydroxyisobutyrate dehydrogenase-like beta-hydroxyacid dehydrogenase